VDTLPPKPANEQIKKPPRKKPARRIIVILLFLILYGALNVGVYLCTTKGFGLKLTQFLHPHSTPAPTARPTPTPRPIPHGPQEFSSGQSDKTVPQITNGTIIPYDPAQGTSQSVIISVKHSQPVTGVTAVLQTDHQTSGPIPFTLVSGTATNGQWRGSWQITDTYLYTYKITIEATSATKTGKVGITLR
jgi:hypothetical protein